MNKPVVVMSGASRGIGQALAKKLSEKFEILSLCRSVHGAQDVRWDFEKNIGENAFAALSSRLDGKIVQGFVHCAGVLGPLGHPDEAKSANYWAEYRSAFSVNVTNALELIHALLPYLKGRDRFVMHLSSGAAVSPYRGWDAYCASKAAMLMAFGCLSKRFAAEELLCLSVAPVTVMTDMMKNVLASDPAVFPDIKKFQQLESEGKLASPESVGEKLAHLILNRREYFEAHGELCDVRKIKTV